MAHSRVSIYLRGLQHERQPVPAARRAGPWLITSGISGMDRCGGVMPLDAASQCLYMFKNLAAVMQAAGGSLHDVVSVSVSLVDRALRADLDQAWEQVFPDPAARPARHVAVQELGSGMLVECVGTAMIDAPDLPSG